jgi:hypothetical protein
MHTVMPIVSPVILMKEITFDHNRLFDSHNMGRQDSAIRYIFVLQLVMEERGVKIVRNRTGAVRKKRQKKEADQKPVSLRLSNLE